MPPTDFAPAPTRALWGPSVGVGGVLFATFALGFTEGCLEVERRPIPLRFALRFAAANLLPSAVWSSVPARHVAAASGVPLSALISDAEVAGSRSITVGKRLVLVKSVRALRLAVGSYGLAWSLWRWHEGTSVDSNNNKQEAVKYGESVVRIAPVNSPLSRASRRKHGQHIVTVPVTKESWKKQDGNRAVDAVNWEEVGVEVQFGAEEGEQVERVKVVEVEISDEDTAAMHARELKATLAKSGNTSLCSVAVLPLCGPPLPASTVDPFDVCFNPLSAVLTFIATVCHDRGVEHVILVADEDDEGDSVEGGVEDDNIKLHLSTSQLAAGLLYRHGISTSVLTTEENERTDEHIEGEAMANGPTDSDSGVVFFVSENLSSVHSAAKRMSEQGLLIQEKPFFIVEESLYGQSVPSDELQAESTLLEMVTSEEIERLHSSESRGQEENDEQDPMATYLSVADVSDQTLQGIRKLIRQGKKPDVIQATVYQAYGTQRVVAPPRFDQFSDMRV